MSSQEPSAPGAAQRNVEAISRLERRAWEHRTIPERLIDTVAGAASAPMSVCVHALVICGWIVWNTISSHRFDPFPFNVLALGAAIEAILLALFILGSQSRLSRQADHRAHLDLQISLLVEAQSTKALSLLQALSKRFDLKEGQDSELEELKERTSVETLHEAVQDSLRD